MTFEPHEKNVELSSKLLFVSFFHLPTGSLGCLSSFSRSVQFPALRILHSHVSSIIHQNEGRNFQKKATRIRHMMLKWCSFHKLLYISTVPVFIKCALSAAQNLLLQFNNCIYALNRRMTSNELPQVECVLHLTYHTSHMLNCTVAGGWTHSKDSNQAKPMSCMKSLDKKVSSFTSRFLFLVMFICSSIILPWALFYWCLRRVCRSLFFIPNLYINIAGQIEEENDKKIAVEFHPWLMPFVRYVCNVHE